MKRIVATALWFYSFWYLGSMVSFIAGVPDLLGPALGVTAGVMVGVDPRHLIWSRTGRTAQPTGIPAAA